MKSPNFEPRPEGTVIDTVVLHYTDLPSAADALAKLCDPTPPRVSAHYLIDTDGTVHNVVDEAYTAWHAGVSYWRGITGLNAQSIGIELQNKGVQFGYTPFPPSQIAALLTVLEGIFARHPIDVRNVVAHSDIAPARKIDPGELFPWQVLAENGFALTASTQKPYAGDVAQALHQMGYDQAAPLEALYRAFNLRWCARNSVAVDEPFRIKLAGVLPLMQ